MKRLYMALIAVGIAALLLMPGWTLGPSPTKFSVGPSLPTGEVKPQLVSGDDEALLLAPDGSLWGWGGTKLQQMGLVGKAAVARIPRRLGLETDWRQVALVPYQGVLALKTDGSLWQGSLSNRFATPARIGTSTNWICVSCGRAHCLALQRDGTLWGWGRNDEGELGDGTTKSQPRPARIGQDTDWKAVSATASTSFCLKRDGTIWGWGLVTLARRPDHARGGFSPRLIDPGTNWVSISAGDPSLVALKSDGTLWRRDLVPGRKWGADFMQIGRDVEWQDGQAKNAGFFDFLANRRVGDQRDLGLDDYVASGTGGFLHVPSLQRLLFAFEPWAFSSGYGNSLLLASDGTLLSWGIRLGAPRPSPRVLGVKKGVNDFLQWFRCRPLFDLAPFQIDPTPYRLWDLPVEVRRSLGKDKSDQNHKGIHPKG